MEKYVQQDDAARFAPRETTRAAVKGIRDASYAKRVVANFMGASALAFAITCMLIISNWIGNITVLYFWIGLLVFGAANAILWLAAVSQWNGMQSQHKRMPDVTVKFMHAYLDVLLPGWNYLLLVIALGAQFTPTATNAFSTPSMQLWQQWTSLKFNQSYSFGLIVVATMLIAMMQLQAYFRLRRAARFYVPTPTVLHIPGSNSLQLQNVTSDERDRLVDHSDA